MQTLRFKDTPASPGGLVVMSVYILEEMEVLVQTCDLDAGLYGAYGGCIMDTLNYPTGFDHSKQMLIQKFLN